MTTINILKVKDNIVGVEVKGHSGYSEEGSDIVCSAVSTITQACLLGLKKVIKVKGIKFSVKDAYLKFLLPEDISEVKLREAEILLVTMYLTLQDIRKAYNAYIQMEDIKYVY